MIHFIGSIQIQMYFKLNNYFVSAFIIFEKSFAQLQIVVFFFFGIIFVNLFGCMIKNQSKCFPKKVFFSKNL